MALLEWKDEYRTGFRSIDYEHQTLILAINDIFGDSNSDQESLLAALAEIHALIEAHFALEEKIMRDFGYADYPDHKSDHDRLLEDIRDIMESIGHQKGVDYENLLSERISTWFARHFGTLDREFHTLVN